MKRKALLVLSVVLMSTYTFAQDLKLDSLFIMNKVNNVWTEITNDTIQTGDSLLIGLKLTNAAGQVQNNGDDVEFGMSLDGDSITPLFDVTLTKNLAPNAGSFSETVLTLKEGFVFTTEVLKKKLCVYVTDSKYGIGGNATDDTLCADVTIWDKVISVNSFTPKEGKSGTEVTIIGSYFGATPADNVVKIGGQTAPIKSATKNKIVVTVDLTSVTGDITVEAEGLVGTSTEEFTVLDADGNVIYPTSISEVAAISSFVGFSNGKLAVNATSNASELQIVNLTGEVVLQKTDLTPNTTNEIDLNELQSGVYIVMYNNEYLKFSK